MKALALLPWAAITVLLIAAEMRARHRPDKPHSTENIALLLGTLGAVVEGAKHVAGVA